MITLQTISCPHKSLMLGGVLSIIKTICECHNYLITLPNTVHMLHADQTLLTTHGFHYIQLSDFVVVNDVCMQFSYSDVYDIM